MSLFLSYEPRKGLIKEENRAYGNYIQEHEEKGKKAPLHEQVLEIPNLNVKIIVRTNLNNGAGSYMYAFINVMDKIVLNFHDTCLNHPINRVYAKPGDWNFLFDGIIELYNSIYNCGTPINSYFNVLEQSLDSTDCTIEKMVYITKRLSEICELLPGSIYADNNVIATRMKRACKLLFRNIEENCGKVQLHIVGQVDRHKSAFKYGKAYMTDGQQSDMETSLDSIFKYLMERNEVLDVLARKDQRTFANEDETS